MPACHRSKLEETKLLQKLRKRTVGLDAGLLGGPAEGTSAGLGQAARGGGGGDNELMDGAYVKESAVAVTSAEDPHMCVRVQ